MKKVYFHTLGCKVNQYDTEAMLEKFLQAGYEKAESPKDADIYITNTCTVTATANKKSLQLARRKNSIAPNADLIIAGCVAQNMGEKLLDTGAKLIIGTSRRSEVVKLYEQAIKENTQICAVEDLRGCTFEPLSITNHSEHTRAVMKIQEGCNNYCSYCIIPFVRGNVRSRKLNDILVETKALAKDGFKEIVLTGIQVTAYGKDLEEKCDLADAVAIVNSVEGIERIRLSSIEPRIMTYEFVQRLKESEKLCPHFHLALQSGSDSVLKRMNRHYTIAEFKQAAKILREIFPNCMLTTDVIAGFPGESDEEFDETKQTIKQMKFLKVHAFPYSQRRGTVAAKMPDQLTKSKKAERVHELIEISTSLSNELMRTAVGSKQEVLIEEATHRNRQKGFTKNYMHVEVEGVCKPGDIVTVLINNVDGDKLIAEKV